MNYTSWTDEALKGFLTGLAVGVVGFLIWQTGVAIAVIQGTQSPEPGDIASLLALAGFGVTLAGPRLFWIARPLMAKRCDRDKD